MPARAASIVSGRTPAPTTTVSQSIAAAALGEHRLDPLVALERCDRLAGNDVDAVVGEEALEALADLLAEAAGEDHGSISTIVQRFPIAVSEAATSAPM